MEAHLPDSLEGVEAHLPDIREGGNHTYRTAWRGGGGAGVTHGYAAPLAHVELGLGPAPGQVHTGFPARGHPSRAL